MLVWFVEKVLRPVWIVNEFEEMGFRVLGVNCYYYKWETPLYGQQDVKWRIANKREFGECVHSCYGYNAKQKRADDATTERHGQTSTDDRVYSTEATGATPHRR